MNANDAQAQAHLSQISTQWSLVFQAHRGSADTVTSARGELLLRYGGALYRYALGALRDRDAAEEVLQEFACCLVRGDFKQAHPESGRFRDYVRTVLFHLVVNHQRQRTRRARVQPLPDDSAVGAIDDPPGAQNEREFLRLWQEELLARTWEALDAWQAETGRPLADVLRLRVASPQEPSERVAQRLSAQTGRPWTAANFRQVLHRAREKFGELLLAEVGRSLGSAEPDQLEQELIDLGLAAYCRDALQRRRGQ